MGTPVKIVTLAFAGILTAASATHGDSFIHGAELLARCTSEYRAQQDFCAGYIAGVVDLTEAQRLVNGNGACMPDVKLKQVTDVVTRYLKDNPADRNIPAAISVQIAIEDAWCPDAVGHGLFLGLEGRTTPRASGRRGKARRRC